LKHRPDEERHAVNTWTFKDGQSVNRMGFGAMRLTGQPGNWGPYPDKPRAERVFRRALELGVNFIDTAISYGAGHSEMLIAEVLHPYPAGLLIATKGGNVKTGPGETRRDGSPANLRASCEASLGYLKVEVIDLYQFHAVDPAVPLEESVGGLADLKREGKIKLVGLCNVTTEQLKSAQRIVEIESVQNKYNLNARESQDVLDYCATQGIAFIPWGPFDAHAFAKGAPLADAGSRLEAMGGRLGAAPGQVALAWLLAQGPHVIPIPGTTSVEHLEENVAAGELALSSWDLSELA
jgi:aryl-alcohol dehydrogenase-like predicted oxidoreductase